MNRDRYINVCETTASGDTALVRKTSSGEEAMVKSCTHEHLLVETRDGKGFCWDYHDCDNLTSAKK